MLYAIAFSILFERRNRQALEILEHFGSAEEAWKHIKEDGMNNALSRAEEELKFIEKHRIATYWCQDENYPNRLAQCPDRPLMLYGKGNLDVNQGKMLAVVGTRHATDRGKELTRQIVLDLASQVSDLTVISGLAYGVDIAAHRAALEANIATHIVTAHGMDQIYPALHRNTAVESLKKGGILTEYISRTAPTPRNFIARDRIIAGLADAVLVVESDIKGGALITAKMAFDYSRDLFAIPGRPSDQFSQGCNQLIRQQKAQIVTCAKDIVETMNWESVAAPKQDKQLEFPEFAIPLSAEQQTIMDKLHEQEDGIHINSIVLETGMDYAKVSSELMFLEMQDLVKSLPGGIYRALK